MKYRDRIIEYFESCPKGTVVAANELYEKHFSKMSQAAFFKALERLSKDNILKRMAKGMYTLASDDDLTNSGERMLNYFFGDNNDSGMYIGEQLYAKYGIIEAAGSEIRLYSNVINGQSCRVGNIYVKKAGIELSYDNARVIEALEILEAYNDIKGIDKHRFARFAKQYAKGYNDEAAVYVIKNMRYKKRTIAFMKKILDMYKIPNSLQQFLSYASDYKVPPVQRIAR